MKIFALPFNLLCRGLKAACCPDACCKEMCRKFSCSQVPAVGQPTIVYTMVSFGGVEKHSQKLNWVLGQSIAEASRMDDAISHFGERKLCLNLHLGEIR